MGPMDPINSATYKLIADLIEEVQEWFPDKYFHVGGDEVQLDCWYEQNIDMDMFLGLPFSLFHIAFFPMQKSVTYYFCLYLKDDCGFSDH